MTTRQRNRYLMFRTLQEWLAAHADELNRVPLITRAAKDFNELVALIEEANAVQDVVAVGKALKKADAMGRLVEALRPVQSVLHAIAVRGNLRELKTLTAPKEWANRRTRGSAVAEFAAHIADAADAHIAELADSGIGEAEIKALREAIDAYSRSANEREISVVERRVARGNLVARMAAAETLLREQLDRLMEQFHESAPALLRGYQHARSEKDLGGRRERNGGEPTAPAGNPPAPAANPSAAS
jgi:hypothetical protein